MTTPRKFRITVHGSIYGTWFKIERRAFGFLWREVASYIDTEERAQQLISIMRESEG